MTNTYIIAVILIGVVLALFTALSFVTKKPFTVINLIVILFMTALVSPMLVKLAYMMDLFPYIAGFEVLRAAPYTFGPLLYFYAKFETGLMKKFTRRDLFHFIPFIIAAIIMMVSGAPDGENFKHIKESPAGISLFFSPDYIPGPPPLDGDFPYEVMEKNPGGSDSFRFLAGIIYVSLTVYTLLIIRLIHRHNSGINDYFSNDTLEINLKWIKWITVCFLLSYLCVLFNGLLLFRFGSNESVLLPLAPDLATTFFIFMFSFFSLKQPAIYAVSVNSRIDASELKVEKKYEKSGLKDETAEKYYKQIVEFMAAEKPYTDPDFTINTLSEKTGIPKHHLTQVLNEKINRNFFMFVNDYRISEVRESIIKDGSCEHSILQIAYDAGFNSKSTFNTMFKKTTGMTPSEFRKTAVIK